MGSTPIAPLSGPAVDRPTASPIVGLVQAAAAGDGAAFDNLVGLRLDRTYRTARAIFGNDHDARDAVQDAWLLVWRQLPNLRDVAAFDAWLDRIVVNTCRSVLRRRGGIREIPMADTFDVRQPGPGPEQVAEREIVERAFERLDAGKQVSLDGHLAVDKGGEITLFGLDGTGWSPGLPRPCCSALENPVLSPDGSTIAGIVYDEDGLDRRLAFLDVTAGTWSLGAVVDHRSDGLAGGASIGSTVWSPDLGSIAILSYSTDGTGATLIRIFSLDGTESRDVPVDDLGGDPIGWLPTIR